MVGNCQKCYTDPSSLRKHIKTVHGDEEYERAKKNKPTNPGGRRRKHQNLMNAHHHSPHLNAAAVQFNMRQQMVNQV